MLHWQGGDHTTIRAHKNTSGQNRWTTEAETGDLIRALSRVMPDQSIAAVLNRSRTSHGHTWTERGVYTFRHKHEIPPYREGEGLERGEVTLEEAAAALATSKMTVTAIDPRWNHPNSANL